MRSNARMRRWLWVGAAVSVLILTVSLVLTLRHVGAASPPPTQSTLEHPARSPTPSPSPAPRPPQGCVLHEAPGAGDYASFPVATTLPSGQVIALWRVAEGHQFGAGALLMAEQKKSGDGCAWSTPRVIYANTTPGETVTIGGVTGVADSTIVVALVRYATPSPTQARDFRSFAVTSHDAGQTWGAPTPMTSGFGGQAYASSLAPAPGSGVLAALYGTDAPGEYAGWYVRLARSTDQGATWQPWGEALRDPEHPFTEPQLLATPDRLLVALRHDSNESGAFLAESSDAGEHFSTPRRITSGTSGMPTLGRAADGRYLMAYREGAAFRYATSRDLVTWSLGFDVTGGSGRRMLYAGFAQLTRGRTVVVYALENPEGDPNTWAGVYSALIPAP